MSDMFSDVTVNICQVLLRGQRDLLVDMQDEYTNCEFVGKYGVALQGVINCLDAMLDQADGWDNERKQYKMVDEEGNTY